jgi:magnesium transporter
MSMTVTFTWAGLIGILAPLTLKRVGADPAVASSVFVLTSIDMASFFVFLGLASLMLS